MNEVPDGSFDDQPRENTIPIGPSRARVSPDSAADSVEVRINEYRDAAIRHIDPLAACLGAQNAELLQLAHDYGPLLASALENVTSLGELRELDGPIARRLA